MREVYKYDSKGYYVEPVLIGYDEDIPENCTDKPLPQPNWKPQFDGEKWIETITEEEKPKPPVQEPTIEERLALAEEALNFIMFGGM